MSLGSFTCPNLIKSSMNNVVTINLTEAVFRSKNTQLSLSNENSFNCEFKDLVNKKNIVVTGIYDSETNTVTCYNELLPGEITGENTLISFALVTVDGKTMNCCSLCSNTCYGSNGTLAHTQMNMKSILDISQDDSKLYIGEIKSDDKTTFCQCNTILPVKWPKKEDYKDIQDYLIDCCKLSLYFRNSCLTCAMIHCTSINQRLSSLYCN